MNAVSAGRLRVVFWLLALSTVVLAVRITYWQTIGRGALLGLATGQLRSDLAIPAHRGVIRDRNGAILATTVDLRSLYAIPDRVPNHAAVAAQLGPLLGQDPTAIEKVLDSGAEWLYLKRRLPEEVAVRVAALGVPGLGFQTEPKRLYPNETVGAHVLGFVNDDGVGQYGVEGRYDTVLKGADGRLLVDRDPANRALATGLRTEVPARNGADLTLTIDLVFQAAAERELRAAIEKEGAQGGSVVVLDPKDGAVLALASYPTFDPAKVGQADPEALRDRSIAWTYEPGSTMKAVTVSGAIDQHVVTPSTTYNDVGYAIVGGRRLNNALDKAWGPTTVQQVLERSLNAGAAFIASRLGAEKLYDYLGRFGFGVPTGVDLAGEQTGTVRPLAQWYPVDLGTAAFGQGLSATPLQLAAAYAAIANGGTLYRPYVVASRRDADGEHRTAPVAVRRVITSETAATLRTMLTSAVDNGLAKNASLAGYSVAGKTGTAQVPGEDGRYMDDVYISSFAGFAPAENPRLVAVVVLDEPQSRLFGTVTATSAFRGMAIDMLRYARVQPDRQP